MKRTGLGFWLTLLLLTLFLGVFLVWPVSHVFARAVWYEGRLDFRFLAALFHDAGQFQATLNSLLIAVCVTLGCVAVSLPLAWCFARYSFPGKSVFSGLMLLPMIMPPFVGAVGLKLVFARFGALSALLIRTGITDGPVDWLGASPMAGIVFLEVLHLFPVMYLNLLAALGNIDPSLEDAAANLGAGRWNVFRRVTLPLAAPGLFAGMALVFMWAFTELGTPLVFGLRRVLPVSIYDQVSEVGRSPVGHAQVALVLVMSVLCFWVTKRMARRRDVATMGRMSVSRTERRLGAWGIGAVWLLVLAVLGLAVIPHVSTILLAFSRRWFLTVLPQGWTLEFFARAMDSGVTRTALWNSLCLAGVATFLDVIIGFAVAWVCVRRRVWGADMVDALAMLPMAVPGLVVAFGYVGCFSGRFEGTALQWLDPRENPLYLLAMSYAVRRLPYMVRAAHAGLEQVSRTYEEAAANVGASPWRVVRRITIPLMAANLLAGGILCFSFSMLEVSDSLILATKVQHYPITKALYTLTEGLDNGINVASALGVWAMCLLGVGLLWATALMGRRIGQMFRVG